MITKIFSTSGQKLPNSLCKRCKSTMQEFMDDAFSELGLVIYAFKVKTDRGHVVSCIWKSVSEGPFCGDFPLDGQVPITKTQNNLEEGELSPDPLLGDHGTILPDVGVDNGSCYGSKHTDKCDESNVAAQDIIYGKPGKYE